MLKVNLKSGDRPTRVRVVLEVVTQVAVAAIVAPRVEAGILRRAPINYTGS